MKWTRMLTYMQFRGRHQLDMKETEPHNAFPVSGNLSLAGKTVKSQTLAQWPG